MTTSASILGAHVWFARDGETCDTGTVAKTLLPGETDDVWIYMGVLKDVQVEGSADAVEVWKPCPGKLVLDDIIETKPRIKLTMTLQEFGPKAVEMVYRSAALTEASTEFTPLATATGIKGWIKTQIYDQDDTQRVITDTWVYLSAKGALKADGTALAELQVEAQVLQSALNNGGIA